MNFAKLSEPKLIVFDLDGLIIDSLSLLSQALKEVIQPLFFTEELLNQFIAFDLSNPGVSRFEKIDHALYLAEVEDKDKESLKCQMLNKFNELALKARCEAELDYSIFDFESFPLNNIEIYLLSNCDNEQLKKVISNHKLDSVFGKNSCGTPPNKSQIFREIINSREYDLDSIWSISDSRSDLIIANDNLVKFYWIKRFAREEISEEEISGKKLNTLKELHQLVVT